MQDSYGNRINSRASAFKDKVLYFYSPIIIAIISPLLSYLSFVPINRRDDVAFLFILVFFFAFYFVKLLSTMKLSRGGEFSIIIWALLVALMFLKSNTLNGLIATIYLSLLTLALLLTINGRSPIYVNPKMIANSLLLYCIAMFCYLAFSGFSNDDFMALTGININSLAFAVLPLFAYCVSISKKNSALNIQLSIYGFLALSFLSGSKQAVFFSVLIYLILIMRGKLILSVLRILFLSTLFLVLWFSSPWAEMRLSEFYEIFTGNIEASNSVVNRIYLYFEYFHLMQDRGYWNGFGMGNAEINGAFAGSSDIGSQFMSNSHTPHNSWLRFLVEGGLQLLIALFLYHCYLGKMFLDRIRVDYEIVAWTAVLLALIAHSLLTESMFSWVYWVAMGQFFLIQRAKYYVSPSDILASAK